MPIRTLLVTAATVLAGVVHAQAATGPAATFTPQAAFESFLRVAATVGKPVAELARIWPAPLTSASSPRRFSVTAAHVIAFDLSASFSTRDGDERVRRMIWDERVVDTVALTRRVGELMRRLERVAGPAERCSDPLGPPANLFADQFVAREWRRGIAEQPTRLTWAVISGGRYVITVTVGDSPDDSNGMYSCDTKWP